jgi:hypothetical protein
MIAVGAVFNFVVELAISFGDRRCYANRLNLRNEAKIIKSRTRFMEIILERNVASEG